MKSMLVLVAIYMLSAINCDAQKAVLYNFKFDVPDKYRKQIQKYDESGNKLFKDEGGKRVPDTYAQQLSKKEVNIICESAAEMLKRKYGYTEVEIMYPNSGWVSSGRLPSFPQRSFKKATKKHAADAYIAIKIDIKDKEPMMKWSDLHGQEMERIMFFTMESNYTIYDVSEAIIDQKTISFTDEMDQLFDGEYATDLDDKGRYKLWKNYFSKKDINGLYALVEQHYDIMD